MVLPELEADGPEGPPTYRLAPHPAPGIDPDAQLFAAAVAGRRELSDDLVTDGVLAAIGQRPHRPQARAIPQIPAVAQHDGPAVVGGRELLGGVHRVVEAPAEPVDVPSPDAVPLGGPLPRRQRIIPGHLVGQRAVPVIDPEPVRATALVGQAVAEGRLAVPPSFQGEVEEQPLRHGDRLDPHRTAREVCRHVRGERLRDVDGSDRLGREEVQRDRRPVRLRARQGRSVHQRVRVPLTQPAYVDEAAVHDRDADHALRGPRGVARGRPRDVFRGDGVGQGGRLPPLIHVRGHAAFDVRSRHDEVVQGHGARRELKLDFLDARGLHDHLGARLRRVVRVDDREVPGSLG